jgi:hydroxypyruvate isomerase
LPAGEEGDEIGKRNFVEGIKRVLPLAEKSKVTLALEMLNSRVAVEMKGHPGYQCDTIEWAVDVCNRVGSDRLKILFDIYHVQIMQGDVITRIRQTKDYIAHYHTAGNPGRNEIDETQEINYPGIMKVIAETGYRGFVGQEFIPTWKDPVAALRHAAKTCDV